MPQSGGDLGGGKVEGVAIDTFPFNQHSQTGRLISKACKFDVSIAIYKAEDHGVERDSRTSSKA